MSAIDRISLPQDKADLVLARKEAGMRRSSIEIGSDGNIIPNGSGDSRENLESYKVVIRKAGRSGDRAISSRAKKLASCRGLKGCDFAECALDAMGKLPSNLLKACPTLEVK